MGIISRFFLLVYSLVVLALALAVTAVILGFLPETVWLNEVNYAVSRPELWLSVFFMALFSLYFIRLAFKNSAPKNDISTGEYVIATTANGEVRVALAAVRDLALRIALETRGVRDVKATIKVKKQANKDSLALKLSLLVGREVSSTELANELTTHLQQQLANILAINDVPVDIVIADVSNEAPVRKHRVV